MEKEKIMGLKKLKELDKSLANNDELILYTISILESKKIEPTFDKIVVAAYKLFPERFSLLGFKEYPDGKRVHDCLFHCTYKTKGWLNGGAKQGYKLSEMGELILKELEGKLEKSEFKNSKKIKKTIAKRKENAIIEKAMKTKTYSYFINGRISELNQDYLKETLRCTPGASKKELKDNYKIISKYAEEVDASENFFKMLEGIKQILKL